MPVPPVIQMYRYVMGSGGGVSNLLQGSEQLGSTGVGRWNQDLMNAVNSDQVNNPAGTEQTADQLDFQADKRAKIRQDVTLVAGTEYTFSVWARAASGTQDFRLSYYDNAGRSFGTSAHTASATWSPTTGRYSFTFTAATSGTFTMFIQNSALTPVVSRRIYFWGAMLNVGATAADYIKTEFTGPSSPATPPMEFGDNFAGVTAYYSLRRFTRGADNNAIRVRRSSDDTEQDIGFDANGDLDTTALLAFVNADYNAYTSDFSANDDGWAAATDGGTADGNIDGIGGQNDVLRFTVDTSTTPNHRLENTTIIEGGYAYTVEFDYYIPSTNANLDSFRVQNSGGSSSFFTETDTWASGSFSNTNGSGGYLRFQTSDGGTVNYTGNGTDVFYMKNIVVTQTTADGAVTTFYDQTGNGNNATNSTASEQPLVVSGGTLVTENSKAAIEFTDGSDYLQSGTLSGFGNIYTVAMANNLTDAFYAYGLTTTSQHNSLRNNGSTTFLRGTSDISFSQSLPTGQALWFAVQDTTSSVHVDGVSKVSGSNGSSSVDKITLSARDGGIDGGNVMQEFILFDSNQSTNRTGMETNINDHFDIYTP